MDSISSLGRMLILIGVAIIIFGALMLLMAKLTGGRGAPLPGDIVIRRGPITIYLPIITSIVISIILTLIFWALAAWRR